MKTYNKKQVQAARFTTPDGMEVKYLILRVPHYVVVTWSDKEADWEILGRTGTIQAARKAADRLARRNVGREFFIRPLEVL